MYRSAHRDAVPVWHRPIPGRAVGRTLHVPRPGRGIVDPALGFVDIPLGRDDVVIAGKEHRGTAGDEFGGMGYEAIEPAQFVVELRARGGVAVRQIQATDYDAVDRRLDVAAGDIIRIAPKRPPGP